MERKEEEIHTLNAKMEQLKDVLILKANQEKQFVVFSLFL